MLRSMPPGVNMDMGKGYDNNDWLHCSSLSQRLMWQERHPSLVLIFSLLFPHVTYLMDSSCFLCLVLYIAQIHSCILMLYQFYSLLSFLKPLPQLQPELKLKVITFGKASTSSPCVIYKSTCPENYIPAVMPPLNPTSPPSTAATFLATHLMAVLQPSRYSVFHGGNTPIQLSLP